jgi:ubiquinol-cytochrome c reductase iron-sulfur subunit
MSDRERGSSGWTAVLQILRQLLEIGSKLAQFLVSITGLLTRKIRSPERIPTSGRDSDQVMETDAQMQQRERIGTVLVILLFLLAVLGAIVFLLAYWSGKNNTQWLGGGLALFLLATGVASVLWARMLMTHKETVEPRHPLKSSAIAEQAAMKTFCDGVHDVRRRRMLAWMGITGAGLFGAMVISLLRSMGISPNPSLYSRIWRRDQRLVTSDGKPVSLSTLQPGSTVTVFPEDQIGEERAQTVLIRVKEELLQMPDGRAGWVPGGYVAYSRVCTHAGCPVGQFEAEQSILLCPCHQSTFDVLRAAAPTGGPAARPLPQLPLYADADGTLRAGGGFTAPPGPGFWGIS